MTPLGFASEAEYRKAQEFNRRAEARADRARRGYEQRQLAEIRRALGAGPYVHQLEDRSDQAQRARERQQYLNRA